uniref:Maleylacetoacetate isomerase n=1 Tax=Panagrolaimus sp. JU765 TaxID=591449 RepID=A0AC34QGF8_9BILA
MPVVAQNSRRSSRSLNLKGVDYEYRVVNLLNAEQKKPEYLEMNPRGMVPLLDFDGKKLSDSVAIMEFLEEKFPDKCSFLPKTPEDRAVVRSLVHMITADIQPVQNMRVIKFVGQGDAEKTATFARHFIDLGFESLEKELAKTAGKFAFGDSITMADIVIPAQVHNARRFGVDMAKFPIISRINETLASLPEFIKADAFHQPDTPESDRRP